MGNIIQKGLLTIFGSIIAIPIVIVLGLMWLQRGEHAPTFYVRVSVDMKVNDQPVHMERVITCETIALGSGGLESLGKRSYTQYKPSPIAFGQRLPDKSAVMMWTPYECDREEYLDETNEIQIRARQNAPDYVPRIGWTSSYSPIETLEYYIDRKSFTHPKTRIKDIKIHSELVSRRDYSPSKADDFIWFSGTVGQRENPRINFEADYALVLNESQWRGLNPILDHELDKYQIASLVVHRPELNENSPSYLLRSMFWELPKNGPIVSGYSGGGVSSRKLADNQLPRGFGQDLNKHQSVIQLTERELTFDIIQNNTWDRLILRHKPRYRPKSGQIKPPYTEKSYLLGDQRIDPIENKHFSRFIYNPVTKNIYEINRTTFTVYPEKDNPLFRDLKKYE